MKMRLLHTCRPAVDRGADILGVRLVEHAFFARARRAPRPVSLEGGSGCAQGRAAVKRANIS